MIVNLPAPVACPSCLSQRRFCRASSKRGWRIWQCSDCDAYFVWPQPSEDELGGLYTARAGYAAAALSNSHSSDRMSWRTLLPGLNQHAWVLDVGCGSGSTSLQLATDHLRPVGVDRNRDGLRTARRAGIEVIAANGEGLPFRDGVLSAAVLGDVLEHVRHPRLLLAEVRRVLGADGLIFVRCPNAGSGFARFSLLVSRWSHAQWLHSEAPYHLFEWGEKGLRGLVEEMGFCTIACRPEGRPSWLRVVGASGHFDNLKRELKVTGGYRVTPGLLKRIPTILAVASLVAFCGAAGSLVDRGRAQCSLVLVARKDGT